MATLLNRVCTLCETETYREDGYVKCNCTEVHEEEWDTGVLETPKEWSDDIDALMHYRQQHYETMIDRQAANEVELKHYIWELERDNKSLRERVANLEKMITRNA